MHGRIEAETARERTAIDVLFLQIMCVFPLFGMLTHCFFQLELLAVIKVFVCKK